MESNSLPISEIDVDLLEKFFSPTLICASIIGEIVHHAQSLNICGKMNGGH